MKKKYIIISFILIVIIMISSFILINNKYKFNVIEKNIEISVDTKYSINIESKSKQKFKYIIKDKNIIDINENGEIIPKKEGETEIIVKSKISLNKKKIRIKVLSKEVDEIKLKENNIELNVGDNYKIETIVNDNKNAKYNLTYISDNEDIVVVDKDGNVSAKKYGKTFVTIKAFNGINNKLYITVNDEKINLDDIVIPIIYVDSVSFRDKEINVKKGKKIALEPIISPSDATDKTLVWSSSNNKIVEVDENGNINAKEIGSAIITTKSVNGKVAQITVNVINEEIPVESIKFKEQTISLYIGDNYILNPDIVPTNATNKSMNWTIGDNKIVDIKNGVLTAKKIGSTTIKVETQNKKTATIKVEVKERIIDVTGLTITTASNKSVDEGSKRTLIANITPDNATNKKVTWSSSDTSVAKVSSSGVVTGVKKGKAIITAKTNNNITSTFEIIVTDPNASLVETYFLNSQQSNGLDYAANETVIIKTKDEKYILFDTGNEDSIIVNMIYNKLKSLQGTSNVTIDYLIISHPDSDHIGNAVNIINHSNIKINYLFIKQAHVYTTKGLGLMSGISAVNNAAKAKGVKRISPAEEGKGYKLGDFLGAYFYNVDDTYKSYNDKKDICSTTEKSIKFASYPVNSYIYTTENGEYVYFDGSKYPNIELKTTKEKKHKNGYSGMNDYYYAYVKEDSQNCRKNVASYAVLLRVFDAEKYIYLPGDIENNGYDYINDKTIVGNGTTTLYENPVFNGTNFGPISPLTRRIPAETNAAKAVKNKLGSKLNNLVIYQSCHHGNNDSDDAIKLLNVNRSDVYAIFTHGTDVSKNKDFLVTKTYYYTLSKTKKFITSQSTNGIQCYVNKDATYGCFKF